MGVGGGGGAYKIFSVSASPLKEIFRGFVLLYFV